MEFKVTPPSRSVLAIFSCCVCFSSLVTRSQAQATTDPSEVIALNSIFRQWDVPPWWNISGELCSGAAIDKTDFDDPDFSPAIRCDCEYNSGTTCHITHLNLANNYFTGPLPAFLGSLSSMKYLSFAANAFSGTIPKELGNLTDLLTL
ncbi:hypothetical protein HHK36_004772 [Tetracentron sinense]|uniref:Uncharacterized protein n=1 Tax=Tetracentron sinense TaxID=13715 RepID=A0A835DLP1_TETSI|nr:hypothetical protein HHK36_004772 [Tetracentron sinense]